MNRPLLMCVALCAVSACTPQVVKDAAPPIRTIANKPQPSADKLVIIPSEAVAPDPEKALQNYEELIKLDPDPETRAESMRRMADLGVEVEDSAGNTDTNGSLQKSIRLYQQLLNERPTDPANDRILYQMARAYQNSGDSEDALATLERLKSAYPNSTLIADVRYRNAELLYQKNRFADAENEYNAVMAFGTGSPFFQQAQYKYGWSQFKQQKFEAAITTFFDILKRELPPAELEDPKSSLAQVAPGKMDITKDALHVVSSSFAVLGGGKAVTDYFHKHGEVAFFPLVYNSVGDLFREKQRYSDAANAYAAFVSAHPGSRRAPAFQERVIAAYKDGGFNDLVVREKERYVHLYEPSAEFWAGSTPTPEVMAALRTDFEDLGRHYQARAQSTTPKESPSARADFLAAAGWYRKILDIFPQDPKLPEVNLLYADALYDGGQTRDAAAQYMKTAYGYGDHPKAREAAYAAIQADQRLAKEVPSADRPAALRDSISASLKLADSFPDHPQVGAVLTRAAEDSLEIKDLDSAVAIANRALAVRPLSDDLRAQALGVVADARFAQGKYPEAEVAYGDLLKITPSGSPQYRPVVEQLAAAIYKQGDAARKAGDLRGAANIFLRVGTVTPDASIRPNADYDAAAAFIALQDWPAAEQTLEGFRTRYPTNSLVGDADKQLAAAYQKDNKPAQAAAVYQRIANRTTESVDTRRESAWLAARLYDSSHLTAQAAGAYEFYVRGYPQPLGRAMDARRRLADIALASGDRARYQYWLRDLVAADEAGGAARSDVTRQQAAQASLELGRAAEADAKSIRITLPLAKSLPARKSATEVAVQLLKRAAGYGFAEQTTAATYELGVVYQDLAQGLRDSERPPNLSPEAREQYDLLLEEQVTPFEDQAILAHEGNLERVKQGLWNESIRKSVDALGILAPAKYGKREKREDLYETLR